jgi:ribose-phosphate pyrophosphokinase
MSASELALFALDATRIYGETVSAALGIPLRKHEERTFEDGEHRARPLVSVRSADVFVLQSLYADPAASVNDKLCRLLFFIGALRDASAATVTAVVPYLCYARQDRKAQPRDPVTTRYVATLFEALGTDRVVTMDVHNLMAYHNAFRVRTEHLEATTLFVDYFAGIVGDRDLVVVSPDAGGITRAERFRTALSRRLGRPATAAFVEKYRSNGVLTGEAVVGEVRDRDAIILDDMISTGATMARAIKACRSLGAARIYAAATHGLFSANADTLLREAAPDRIVVTDTVPPFRLPAAAVGDLVIVLRSDRFVAEAIRRLHAGESLVALMEDAAVPFDLVGGGDVRRP